MSDHHTQELPAAPVDHAARAHAILSASGSDRWIHCPGSIQLCRDLPDTSSEFAEWGTVCHELGEMALRARFLGEKQDFQQRVKQVNPETGAVTEVPKFDAEHFAAVATYRDYVTELIARYGEGEQPVVIVERRLKFRRWVPQGFGTGDCILVFPRRRRAVMVDLKGGEGVLVSPEWNSQLMLYGAGTLDYFGGIVDIDEVVLSICQPRRDNLVEWTIDTRELLGWLETIRPIAEEAFAGSNRLVAGDHCKFCKAAARCPERARVAMTLFKDTPAPALLSMQEIGELLPHLKLVEEWAKKLQFFAYDAAVNQGIQVPGHKLVAGRAYRQWSDPAAAAEVLKEEGLNDDEIWNKKLVGITDLEKKLGKKHRVFELTVKGDPKPTLVPAEDPRPEWRSTSQVLAAFDD